MAEQDELGSLLQEINQAEAKRTLGEQLGAAIVEPLEQSVLGTMMLQGFGFPVDKPAQEKFKDIKSFPSMLGNTLKLATSIPAIPGRLLSAPFEQALPNIDPEKLRLAIGFLFGPGIKGVVDSDKGVGKLALSRGALPELVQSLRSLITNLRGPRP